MQSLPGLPAPVVIAKATCMVGLRAATAQATARRAQATSVAVVMVDELIEMVVRGRRQGAALFAGLLGHDRPNERMRVGVESDEESNECGSEAINSISLQVYES